MTRAAQGAKHSALGQLVSFGLPGIFAHSFRFGPSGLVVGACAVYWVGVGRSLGSA